MTSGDRPDDPDFDDKDLFGIDLGHRGVRDEDNRDEVEEPPPPARTARTLSDRLASAKADRELDEEDDRRRRARDDDEDDGADGADPAE